MQFFENDEYEEYMDMLDESYQKLYNFQPMTPRQKEHYKNTYFPLLNFDFVTIVVNDKNEDTAPDEVGELLVKGPGVMKCYYRNPKATEESFMGDWLRTGDMAKMDADGFVYLVDRKKDVIISGGENLYPVQIEDFLRTHGKIKDVAVIGLPDERLGEIAAAIIEVKEGEALSETEVNDFCRALPRYKRPRKLIFAKVPRNPTGKIEKPLLRERYGATRLVEAQMNS